MTYISNHSAIGGGNVIVDGGQMVTARGVCWSSSPNPTIAGNHTNNGTGRGTFVSAFAGLVAGTTYYVRAYAINSVDTAYGEQQQFTTIAMPNVVTAPVTGIMFHSAICGGNVIDDGGQVVTARGVCWSTSPNPTIADDHTTDGNGMGNFISSLTELVSTTTYYVRAYAINNAGVAYGNTILFTTEAYNPCPNVAVVTDIDNNVYNTVQIGQQCWMRENLRTTRYADGNEIPLSNSIGYNVAYRYYPNNDSSNVFTYGYLYNGYAVMYSSSPDDSSGTVQGICPTGWHVPSSADWTQLTNYVQSQPEYICETCSGTNCIAKSFASINDWNGSEVNCSPGYIPSFNNATGFTVVPSGTAPYSIYNNFGGGAYFWSSSTFFGAIRDWRLKNNETSVTMDGHSLYDGLSIRCIKD